MRRMKVWVVRVQEIHLAVGQIGFRLEWVATLAPFFSRKQCEDWIEARKLVHKRYVFSYEAITPEEIWSDPKVNPFGRPEKKHNPIPT